MTDRTLYLITAGCYSDYHVVAAFDDRALAEAFIAAFGETDGSWNEMGIEEHPLNPLVAEVRAGMRLFSVEMGRDGNGARAERIQGDPLDLYLTGPSRDRPNHDRLRGRVVATSAEHAIKIVNERRAQMLAELSVTEAG